MSKNKQLLDALFIRELEQKSTREAFGEIIIDLAKQNKDIVVLNANLESSLKLSKFTELFHDRSIQVGVAEQNMASIATGLALYGKIPFICSFAAFSPGLNFSQIRLACISNANIKIISSHYGVNIGEDGVSAQMTEDIGMLRSIPNITIITPCDYTETKKAIIAAVKYVGPVYIRLTRSAFPVITQPTALFEIGKANILQEGKDCTIVATGSMVWTALVAANMLKKEGITARVVNMHTIKPIDERCIVESAKKTGLVLTIEEHQVNGGLGSAVAEVLSQQFPVPLKIMGIENKWGESGTMEQLYKSKKLTPLDIVQNIHQLIATRTKKTGIKVKLT